MPDQAPPKIMIPLTPELCHKWDTMARRCRLSRHEWIVGVLGHVCEMGPAPILIEAKVKVSDKAVTRVNIRATERQLAMWEDAAARAHLPLASWARLMISAAADPSLAQHMRKRFVLAEHCATNDRPKHQ